MDCRINNPKETAHLLVHFSINQGILPESMREYLDYDGLVLDRDVLSQLSEAVHLPESSTSDIVIAVSELCFGADPGESMEAIKKLKAVGFSNPEFFFK